MSDDDFTPSGAYWTWPLWRKALAWATLRPYCLAAGYVAMARQVVALRWPNRPFSPTAWVHELPCDSVYCDGHDEEHRGLDKCSDTLVNHGLNYERDLDVPRSFADDFDIRVGRLWAWNLRDVDEQEPVA